MDEPTTETTIEPTEPTTEPINNNYYAQHKSEIRKRYRENQGKILFKLRQKRLRQKLVHVDCPKCQLNLVIQPKSGTIENIVYRDNETKQLIQVAFTRGMQKQ